MKTPLLEGDLSPHFFSISGAAAACGISTSTVNREAGGTFPPKQKLSRHRRAIRAYQVAEWIFEGKRGEWV